MTARKPALLLLATAGVLALGLPAQAQELPAPPSNGNVLDSANLLTDGEETELSALIDRKNAGTDAARVVVHTTDSAPGGVADYATALGDAWGVGEAGKDNGVVVVVDMGGRETYIAVADGAGEQISDSEARGVASRLLGPALADENYAAGLSDTVTELYLLAEGGESAYADGESSPSYIGWVVGGILGLLVAIMGTWVTLDYRRVSRRAEAEMQRHREENPGLEISDEMRAAYIKYRYSNRKPPAEGLEEQDEKLRKEEEKTGQEYTRYAGTFNSWLPLYVAAPLLYSGSNVTPDSGSGSTGSSDYTGGTGYSSGSSFGGGGGFSGGGGGSSF